MMEFCINSLSSILFLPLYVILMIMVNKSVTIMSSKKLTALMTLSSTLICFIFSFFAFKYCVINPDIAIENNIDWLKIGNLTISFGVLIDNLSVLMLMILTSISFLIQLYSYGYMKNDKSFHRFYIYLNFFNFSMLGLILSSNLIQTYIFWELVGLSSYLLIGFWFTKQSAANAAKKAFLINRIGDVGLLIGIVSLICFSMTYNSSQNLVLLAFSNFDTLAESLYSVSSNFVFCLLCLLLLMGSLAKSAQFPLQTWLADAMEGPTPVSALIHAATMVAAGVFLVARLYPLYSLSKMVMLIIASIGLFTALITALFAMTQNDIKKLLAFSTSSQLGLMFLALGVGAYTGAIFHLTVHAYAKALLFLVAGCVIHAMSNEQNMKYLGGLRKYLPICSLCYLLGCLSLSGVPIFSGFFSKEMILTKVCESGNIYFIIGLLVVTFMTAFYMFRSYFLIFEGTERFEKKVLKNPPSMIIPILLLAVPTTALGYFLNHYIGKYIYFISPVLKESLDLKVLMASIILVFTAILFVCFIFYITNNSLDDIKFAGKKVDKLMPDWTYWKIFDNIYNWMINQIFYKICRFFNFLDKYLVDGAIFVISLITRFFSFIFAKSQTGNVQSYVTYSICFIAITIFIYTLIDVSKYFVGG